MSPKKPTGRHRISGAGESRPRGSPAAMIATVAATGRIAAVPGNGVVSS